MKITVDNLPGVIGSGELREMFEAFGEVASAKLETDAYGEPTGFGSVEMPDESEARSAIEALDDSRLGERIINVYEAGSLRDNYSFRGIFRE